MTGPVGWGGFLDKLDWEGGIVEMLEYGGPDAFPDELRADATIVRDALRRMEAVIDDQENRLV